MGRDPFVLDTPRNRKRAKNAAKRARTKRRSRAKPKTGWSLGELAALTGVSLRTARLYLERDLIHAPRFAASATRYARSELLKMVAIRRLRAMENLELADIKRRIGAWTAEELEAFATADIAPGPLATALGISPPPPPSPALSVSALASMGAAAPSGDRRWARLELALGLEIHVREDASPQVLALAQRFLQIARGG